MLQDTRWPLQRLYDEISAQCQSMDAARFAAADAALYDAIRSVRNSSVFLVVSRRVYIY